MRMMMMIIIIMIIMIITKPKLLLIRMIMIIMMILAIQLPLTNVVRAFLLEDSRGGSNILPPSPPGTLIYCVLLHAHV